MRDKLLEKFKKYLMNENGQRARKIYQKLTKRNGENIYGFLRDIIFEVMCPGTIIPEYLKISLNDLMKQESKEETLFLILNINLPFAFVNYLKTGKYAENMDNILDGTITLEQFINIKNKNITHIKTELDSMSPFISCAQYDERFESYTEYRMMYKYGDKFINEMHNLQLAYKMYLILGLVNSLELIKGYYGDFNLAGLIILFRKCNISNVQVVDGIGVIDENLVNFLTNSKKSEHNVLKRMNKGEFNELFLRFSELYNKLEIYKSKVGNKLSASVVNELLKDVYRGDHNPEFSSYLKGNIVESYGRYDEDFDDEEIVDDAMEYYYENIYPKVESSIPRVVGEYENFIYEVLKVNDSNILELGYRTKNCFRIDGLARNFLDYYCKSNHVRILIIKDKDLGLMGMVPIIRNGNAIAGNGIEVSSHYNLDGKREILYKTVVEAFKAILEKSKDSREPIVLGTLTNRNQRVSPFNGNVMWTNIMPLYIDEMFINNFSETQYVVATSSDYYNKGFSSYIPDAVYMDERDVILFTGKNDHKNYRETEKRVWDIMFKCENRLDLASKRAFHRDIHTVCNTDWFISIGEDLEVYGTYLERDSRAKEEYLECYNIALEKVKEYRRDGYDEIKEYFLDAFRKLLKK